jgi:hypothetical protein
MPVVSMMRIPGDPDELGPKVGRLMDSQADVAKKHGALLSMVARDGDAGLLVINVWETEEGRHAMAEEPVVREAVAAAEFPEPHFEGYPIIAIRTTDRLGAVAVG